jgi:hypothetical protein
MRKLWCFTLVVCLAACKKNVDEEIVAELSQKYNTGESLAMINAGAAALATANYTVSTVEQLVAALKTATRGQKIYIADNAVLNCSGLTKSLYIPAGITLESGLRFDANFSSGSTMGAKLYLPTATLSSLLRILGDSVTIRGLKIHGPDRNIDGTSPISCGVKVVDYRALTVDNCEIAGWSYAGVNFINSKAGKVTNSYIHHNRRNGIGYGISLDSAAELVADRNLMDNNRHCIAGSGHRTQSYEIKNSILRMTEAYPYNSSLLDMHGESEMRNGTTYPNSTYAGKKVWIHHNSIRNSAKAAIVIRGIPLEQSRIEYNTFDHASVDKAVVQYLPKTYTKTGSHQFILAPFNNMVVLNNYYMNR